MTAPPILLSFNGIIPFKEESYKRLGAQNLAITLQFLVKIQKALTALLLFFIKGAFYEFAVSRAKFPCL